MNAQAGLFDVGENIDVMSVFPQYEIDRSSELDFSGRLNMSGMRDTLCKLGFTVGGVRTHTGNVLIFPVGPGKENGTLFDVSYPTGWTVTDDVSSHIYTGDHNPVRQVLDHNGHLRALLFCGHDKIPLSARLYRRYSIWRDVPLNFATIPETDRSDIRSVVVDMTKINPLTPSTATELEHVNRRWLLAEKYPHIRELAPDKRQSWLRENTPKIMANMSSDCGSSLWLDEHFPHWRDPAAYWPA